MQLEVEQKHLIDNVDEFARRLVAIGVEVQPPESQIDTYYNHPARDFKKTDEALRIRRVDKANYITYKGPKLDKETKTRSESELPLPAGEDYAAAFGHVLLQLGFEEVAIVQKTRCNFKLTKNNLLVTGSIDSVDGVGHYVELEVSTDEAGADDARRAVAQLADQLSLGPSERRSYLELLLQEEKA